jgi:5-methylcytosine-specific restriction endonuclease McrA
MTYNINNIFFTTIDACVSFTKNLIIRLGISEIDQSSEYFNYFYELIKYHPDYNTKFNSEIKKFGIQLNYSNKSPCEMYTVHDNGIKDTFSWKKCCKNINKNAKKFNIKNEEQSNLINAMRHSIYTETNKYKQSKKIIGTNNLMCAYCNEIGDFKRFDADHLNPPFKDISNDFLKNRNDIPHIFDKCPINKMITFTENDEIFMNEWRNFHNSYANFQILCKSCNSKKGDKYFNY